MSRSNPIRAGEDAREMLVGQSEWKGDTNRLSIFSKYAALAFDVVQVSATGYLAAVVGQGGAEWLACLPFIYVAWMAAWFILHSVLRFWAASWIIDLKGPLALSLAFILVALALVILPPSDRRWLPELTWVGIWATASVGLSAALAVGAALLAMPARRSRPDVALLGVVDCARALAMALAGSTFGHWPIVATLRHDNPENLRRFRNLVSKSRVGDVVIGLPEGGTAQVGLLREQLMDLTVPLSLGITADQLDDQQAAALRAGQLSFPALLPFAASAWRLAHKRAFDLIFVAILLPTIAPVLVMTALAIRLTSPGPVIFRQWRFGLGGRPILIWKFRTMYVDRGDRSGEQRTLARDPRVTPVGRILRRTSIDELPQLLNVLRGEMSLVGPRPHTPHMRVNGVYYQDAVGGYHFRHRVKPGLTGWAQVNGSRGEVDTLEKARRRVDLDLWYIGHCSLPLDTWIVLRTVFGGFASPGAD